MCGFNEGGDIFQQVCIPSEIISKRLQSKAEDSSRCDMCFCVIATVYLVSILGTLRLSSLSFGELGIVLVWMQHLCFIFMLLSHISVTVL